MALMEGRPAHYLSTAQVEFLHDHFTTLEDKTKHLYDELCAAVDGAIRFRPQRQLAELASLAFGFYMSLSVAGAVLIFVVPYEMSAQDSDMRHKGKLQGPYNGTHQLWIKLIKGRKASEARRCMRVAKLPRSVAELQAWKPWMLTG